MFEKELTKKLERIFDLERVSFAKPSESEEQDVLFVEIDTANVHITDGKARGRVQGTVRAFADHEKMKHGYFARSIAKADSEDTRDFVFANIDESSGTYRDLDMRSASFMYFFNSQYDPDQGIINELNMNIEVTE